MSEPRRPRMELDDVERVLARLAREEQETLEQADGLAGTGREERVAEILGELELPPPRRRPGWAWGWVVPLALAASVLVVLQLRGGGGDGPGGNMLAPDGVEILSPGPGSDRWLTLEWRAPEDWRVFVVRVSDPERPAQNDLLLGPERVEGTRLDLDPADTATWPDTIFVEIRALDASGELLDTEPALLSLSSR